MEYEVIEKEERLQFLEEMFESTELKVTESYNYPTIMEDLSNVVLYHIKEVTFEGEEKSPRREAFENVIGMIQNEGVNFIYLIFVETLSSSESIRTRVKSLQMIFRYRVPSLI